MQWVDRILSIPGHLSGRLSQGLTVVDRGGSDLKDWVFNVNRSRIVDFARERFAAQFPKLDDGDKKIMRAFLEPDPIANTVSLLGVPPWPRLDQDSELRLMFDLEYLNDTFGADAEFDVSSVRRQPNADVGRERWFFVNGIMNNRAIADASARKLNALLGRDFTTIFNPTHGLIADLAESALQKFIGINTEPVAHAVLEIARALTDARVDKVGVIAHSQGTIVMGDVLDLIYHAVDPDHLERTNMNPQDFEEFFSVSHSVVKTSDLEKALRPLRGRGDLVENKLELYMFANAASRMCYLDPVGRKPHIESFANAHDIVTRLGCLAEDELHQDDLIRIDGHVFVRPQSGHLLNAHYLANLREGYVRLEPRADAELCVRRSIFAPVPCNPCLKNLKAVGGDPAAKTPRLLSYL